MKSEPFKPSVADKAAVSLALDSCCKVDTSVITFFGKKRNKNSKNLDCTSMTTTTTTAASESIPFVSSTTAEHGRLQCSTPVYQEQPRSSSSQMTLSTPAKAMIVLEENETLC